MAGQLADSMQADAPSEDDIPERPIFTNISSFDDDEDDEDERPLMVAEEKSTYGAKRTPIVQPTRPSSGSTYRPSYIPPKPTTDYAPKKPKIQVDTSKITAGSVVIHKAFGAGQVKGIDGALIVVSFNGADKKFQFPGAFEQGFLKLDE